MLKNRKSGLFRNLCSEEGVLIFLRCRRCIYNISKLLVFTMAHLRYLHILALAVTFIAKSDASSTASRSRQRQFQMTYLLDVIPHKSIKTVILGSKKAGSQVSQIVVYVTCYIRIFF